MKLKSLFLIFSFAIFLFSQCRKHTAEQLPPETQNGAGTLGFTINGKIYKTNFPVAFSTYIYLNFQYPYSNGYFLTVGVNQTKWGIGILTDSLQIFEGQIYSLNNNQFSKGKASASFDESGKIYYSKPYLSGELRITKLDSINKIIAGTFWYDAVDTTSNATINIRDGRFDLHYTQ